MTVVSGMTNTAAATRQVEICLDLIQCMDVVVFVCAE